MQNDLALFYDRLEPVYDRLHSRWLRHSGGEAQAALEASVRALATYETNLLDVGCGTGAFARALLAERIAPERMTLLDPSGAMLARCADLPCRKVHGRLEALPFEDGGFDIVTCAWALEAAQNTDTAIRELCRVVRRGGTLCLAFCADRPTRGLADRLMRQAVLARGAGQFLSMRAVINAIEDEPGFHVRALPCAGPAAALIAKRHSL